MTLLEVSNLTMYYETLRGNVHAVEDVSFELEKGRVLGLAGESGCGKTSVALSILRLLPSSARIKGGKVVFDGEDLLGLPEKRFREEIRWRKLSVVFQGAMNSLHPIFNVRDQIAESVILHEKTEKRKASERACRLLDLVGVGREKARAYPHELSGGMKQRVVIAMALACNPLLVIADEPTTALDVIVQAQVLKILRDLQKKLDLSLVEISHDLSMVAETCDEIAIMYAGRIVECGEIVSVFKNPLHPYTKKLISAFPSVIGPVGEISRIPGFPPDLLNPPPGCRFHPRCPKKSQACVKDEPRLVECEQNHFVACHLV